MHIKKQSGVTMVGWLIILVFVVTTGWTTVVITGIYMERMKIRSALEALQGVSFITQKSPDEIKQKLYNQLDADGVSTERLRYYKKLFKVDTYNGTMTVSIDYEVRKSYFGSYDIIAKFKDKVDIVAN